MKKSVLPVLMLLLGFNQLVAQPATLLTADEAVRLALEQNFNILLVQGDADIARLNNTKANAGMLPTVNLVMNETVTLSAFQQKLANGNEFNTLGAPFNVANAAVQLNWTLFDGRRMYTTKRRLEEQEALGSLRLRNEVQQTTAAVLMAYIQIVRSRMQERALEEVIALNEERLRIADARLIAGFAAQTDALQARIDLNQRRSDLLSQQTNTLLAKQGLNQLLARPAAVDFEVDDRIEVNYVPERDRLLAGMADQNPGLLALMKDAEIAALGVDETRSLYKPRITGTGQLIAQRSDNGAGFLLNNTQAGISVGASLVLPLYTGGNIRRQVDVAQLAALQASIRASSGRLALETAVDQQLAQFLNGQSTLVLEEENVINARESLNISTERFRLGQTTALEVQSAQNILEQALLRRNLALTNLKITELELRLLAGEL
jgi:outer membrane protein